MAIDLKGKKTSLEEEASIYAKRDDNQSERERFRNMSGKERRVHFTTYYLPKLLIILAVASVIFYIVWVDLIDKADIYMRCAVLNESISDSSLTKLSDDFTQSMNMDIKDNKSSFYIYYTRSDIAMQYGSDTSSDLSAISSRLVSNMLDTMIAAPEDVEESYLENGFITDLNIFLSKEEYKKLKDYLYIPNTEKHHDGHAYGISLTKSTVYQSLFSDREPLQNNPTLFVISNATSEGKEYAKKLIYFLFPEVFR